MLCRKESDIKTENVIFKVAAPGVQMLLLKQTLGLLTLRASC